MAGINIISEEPISMAELKSELDKIKKRDEQLNFRAGKTEEYLNQFSKLDQKKVEELKKGIEALGIPRMKPEHIVKIVDLMPKTEDDVKLVFQGSTLTLTNENIKKIAGLTSQE